MNVRAIFLIYFGFIFSYNMIDLYNNPKKYLFDVDLHPNEKGANLIYLSARKFISNFLETK